MKNIGTKLAAAFLAAIFLLYVCTFEVRFTEVAIKMTWSKPADQPIVEPGLKFKWPRPIQTVVIYDKRTRILEDKTEETRTQDGRNILLTTFTLWRITDPATFLRSFPDGVEDGEKKLRTTIITHKQTVTGKRELDEFISIDPDKRKLRDIEQEIMLAVAGDVRDNYGIEVVDFGIKKLGLPESVTTDIFRQMKSNEERKASKYTAEGEARARKIIAQARATESRIIAAAQRKVAQIKNDAQRVVGDYYKEFEEYPALRIYLDQLRTTERALSQRATLILSTTDEDSPFGVFDPSQRAKLWLPEEPAGEDDETSDSGVVGPQGE